MAKLELIATAAFGLEAVVARELKQLGYTNFKMENGKVTFVANERAICHTNLWLRSADRILLKVGEFKATSFEELFQQIKALAWSDWLPEDACFPVVGKSINSKLFSISDCQAIVKKAIIEKWSVYILTANKNFEKCFGRAADRKRKLYSGRLKCYFYQYQGSRPNWR